MPQANTVSAKTSILNHIELVESTTAQTDGMSNLSIHGRRPNALPRPKNGSCDTYLNQDTQIFTKLSVTFKDDPSLHHPGLMPPICMHPTSFKSTHIARNSASGFTAMPAISTQNSGSDIDIPDLVSGFDKHAATIKPNSTEDIADVLESRPMCTSWPEDSTFFAGNIGHESPYITSKSFDELHKCLGSNLSSLDLNDSHDSNDSPAVSACKNGLSNPIVAITTDPNKSKSSAIRELILADHSASINPSQDIVLPPNGAFPLCTYPAISVPSQILGESVNTHLPVPPPQHELQMYNAQFLGQSHCYEFSNFNQNGKIGTFTEYHGASVPKVDGTVSSYQSGNYDVHNFPSNHSRGHSVESTEEPKKRHHLGTDHSCFHQLPYDAERKRLKISHDASFSHAVSASENSSDAGFDSDPVSSTE